MSAGGSARRSHSSINYRPRVAFIVRIIHSWSPHYADRTEKGKEEERERRRTPGCAKRPARKVFSRTFGLVVRHRFVRSFVRSLERDRRDAKNSTKKKKATDCWLAFNLLPKGCVRFSPGEREKSCTHHHLVQAVPLIPSVFVARRCG